VGISRGTALPSSLFRVLILVSSVTFPITDASITSSFSLCNIYADPSGLAVISRDPSAIAATGSIRKASQTILTSSG